MRWLGTQAWIGTKALIAISVLVFAADLITGQRILHWGAVSHEVWAGQWQRLLLPHFIHSGVSHIAFNMYALYVFGRLVEGMIGTGRFLVVYFLGGIIGFYASLLVRPEGLAVGASAAIFSLMGYTLHYRLRCLPKRWLGIDSAFAQILGLNLIIGFTVPNVDQYAHLGGLLGGAVAGSLVGMPAAPGPVREDEEEEAIEPGEEDELLEPEGTGGHEEAAEAQETEQAEAAWEQSGAGQFSEAVHAGEAREGAFVRAVSPAERIAALLLVAALSWAALSPLSFAKATGSDALLAFAEERYGGYFAPYVAVDVALLWLSGNGDEDWRLVQDRLTRTGDGPIALGVYWRWARGGGRTEAGEYAVYWRRLDASGTWRLWHVDQGRVVRVDPQDGLIYRRSLLVERTAGELDGRWQVTVEVNRKRQYEKEFEIVSSARS